MSEWVWMIPGYKAGIFHRAMFEYAVPVASHLVTMCGHATRNMTVYERADIALKTGSHARPCRRCYPEGEKE